MFSFHYHELFCQFELVDSTVWLHCLPGLFLLILVHVRTNYYYYYYYYWKFQRRLVSLVKKRKDVITGASTLRTVRSGICAVTP